PEGASVLAQLLGLPEGAGTLLLRCPIPPTHHRRPPPSRVSLTLETAQPGAAFSGGARLARRDVPDACYGRVRLPWILFRCPRLLIARPELRSHRPNLLRPT